MARRDDDTPSTMDDGSPTTTTIDSLLRAVAAVSVAPAEPAIDEPLAADDRFTDVVEIARGGMGRILSARDHRLQRTVAIKELRTTSAALRRRFARETLLTARLAHPSIVSVHEAGQRPSGTPWFAMKLVPGRPLDQVIAEAGTLAARIALVPHVLAVADALAYAHQERVIHRDLKPHNVLVGSFGETVVIDWGLAKDLASPDEAEATADAAPAPAPADPAPAATTAGDVLGTPAYMPPEQAAGEAVDERADVYAIGALLYHLLAGGPPYRGGSSADVLAAVRQAPPPPLVDVQPAAPAELMAIVTRAMARTPADRYPTARELAADLRRFLSGQLVGAHAYSAVELARRWLRRHRGAVAVAAVAALVLLVVGVVAIRGVLASEARADDQRARAEQHRADAEELMRFMLGDLRDKLAPVGKLELLEAVAQKARDYYQARPATADPAEQRARAQIHEGLADVLAARADTAGALAELRAAQALREAVGERAGADRRALTALLLRTSAVLQDQGDRAGALAAVVRARTLLAPAAGDPDVDHDLIKIAFDEGEIQLARGELDACAAAYATARTLAERLTARDPANPTWLRDLAGVHERLGRLAQRRGTLDVALTEAQATLALRTQLTTRDPANTIWQRDLALAERDLGDLELMRGNPTAALAAQLRARAIAAALVARDPSNATWQSDLSAIAQRTGDARAAAGDTAGALEEQRTSQAIMARLVAQDPASTAHLEGLAIAHNKVGVVLQARGDAPAALAAYRSGQAICTQLTARDPANADWQRLLGLSHGVIAYLLVNIAREAARAGAEEVDTATPEAEYQAGLAIFDKLAAAEPTSTRRAREAAQMHRAHADLLLFDTKTAEAMVEYRRFLATVEALAAREPQDFELARDVLIAHQKIGSVLHYQDDDAGSRVEYERALTLAQALARAHPDDIRTRGSLAVANELVGEANRELGEVAAARAAFAAAVAAVETALVLEPTNAVYVSFAKDLRNKLATCCAKP